MPFADVLDVEKARKLRIVGHGPWSMERIFEMKDVGFMSTTYEGFGTKMPSR